MLHLPVQSEIVPLLKEDWATMSKTHFFYVFQVKYFMFKIWIDQKLQAF